MIYDKNLLTDVQGGSDLIPKRVYQDKELTIENILSINHRFMGAGMSRNYFAIPTTLSVNLAKPVTAQVTSPSPKRCSTAAGLIRLT